MWSPSANSMPSRFPAGPISRDALAAEVLLSQQQQHQMSAVMRGVDGGGEMVDSSEDACVDLEGMDLWEQFHDIGTEMVITKCGRYVAL